MKDELWKVLGCFLKPDMKGSFADSVIPSSALMDTGVVPDIYNKVTVNSKGQVIFGELTDPLGDPIHSPGSNGWPDCADGIGVPEAPAKGLTRVRIDEFGRVIKGDCVSPHTSGSPLTYDTVDVDEHGRVAVGVFNNLNARLSALEGGGVPPGGAGNNITYSFSTLVSSAGVPAWTPLPIGTPPAGTTSIYLSGYIRMQNLGEAILQIKDANGIIHSIASANANDFGQSGGTTRDASRAHGFFNMVNVSGALEYRVVLIDAGGATVEAFTIERWGWLTSGETLPLKYAVSNSYQDLTLPSGVPDTMSTNIIDDLADLNMVRVRFEGASAPNTSNYSGSVTFRKDSLGAWSGSGSYGFTANGSSQAGEGGHANTAGTSVVLPLLQNTTEKIQITATILDGQIDLITTITSAIGYFISATVETE
jgi:hypothetical protein